MFDCKIVKIDVLVIKRTFNNPFRKQKVRQDTSTEVWPNLYSKLENKIFVRPSCYLESFVNNLH